VIRRPVVGITAALENASWVVWQDTEVNLSQRNYSACVADAGALPVLLPADEASADSPDELLDVIDALVLSGGADLDPGSYGAEPHPKTLGYKAERDRFELALARGALDRDMPVLGICRGTQLLNVACGGSLNQHLGDSTRHVGEPGVFSKHEVRLGSESLAARVVGVEYVEVRSHHHQGIERLGAELLESGWSVPDDVVEAIELPDRSFAVGVMWHPEEVRDVAPFAALAEAARAAVAA
jgi:putative glutamine amidotransferase